MREKGKKWKARERKGFARYVLLRVNSWAGFTIILSMSALSRIAETDLDPSLDRVSVASIAVAVEAIGLGASPFKLLSALSSFSTVPVVDPDTHELLKVVRDEELLSRGDWTATGVTAESLAQLLQTPMVLTGETLYLGLEATLSEARRLFQESGYALIPIVDHHGRYSGQCASRRKLIQAIHTLYTPPRMGGMATPLGVYMHTGYLQAGPGPWALVLTGTLFAVFAMVMDWTYVLFLSVLSAFFPSVIKASMMQEMVLQTGFYFICMLLAVRLSPISGLHAAEHMTINAIENGLDLTRDGVRQASRVHKRCGTNLMVLIIGVQMAILSVLTMESQLSPLGAFFYGLAWVVFLSLFWRTSGAWIQMHFTTKPPTDTQLDSGIRAGQSLLTQYLGAPHGRPSFLRRLWASGMLQVLASFGATYWLLKMLEEVLFKLV